ncbi:MAG: type II toxin-antitoxin system antitoxin [Ruminiclostridium sp.]
MADKKSILLRISPKMWEEITKWADDEFRSVNGQIEYILSDALRKRNKSTKSEFNCEGTDEDSSK